MIGDVAYAIKREHDGLFLQEFGGQGIPIEWDRLSAAKMFSSKEDAVRERVKRFSVGLLLNTFVVRVHLSTTGEKVS